MFKDERKKELDRVCALAGKKRDVFALLSWMGSGCIENASFRTNQRGIYFQILARGSSDPEPDKRAASNLVRDTRAFLKKVYLKKPSPYNIWITIPNGNDVLEEDPFGDGAYTVRFLPVRPTQYVPEGRLGPSAQFWKRMISPVQPEKGLLLYSAEQPELGKLGDKRGLYSGSGEVAAAFRIGSRIAHFNNVLDTGRSNRVSLEQLKTEPSWMIFLGSSIVNPILKELRADERWSRLQDFHFEERRRGGRKTIVICTGGLRGKVQETYSSKSVGYAKEEEEFALISYLRDGGNSQVIIALQGITTIGTWAAAEFLCSDTYVEELQKREEFKDMRDGGELPSFEICLRVSVRDHAPAGTSIERIVIHDVQANEAHE
jgi:hypothetical protein